MGTLEENASLLSGGSDDDGFSLKGTNTGNSWYNKKTGFTKQSCTDITCCTIFGILMLTTLGFVTFAIIAGDYKKLYHGMNHQGQFCGIDLPDEEYVYFCKTHANVDKLDFGSPVCVTTCPDSSSTQLPCPVGSQPAYPSHAVAGFYCFPDGNTQMKQVSEKMAEHPAYKVVSDAYLAVLDTWPIMVVTAFTSLLIGYMYLFMLRSFAKSIIVLVTIVTIAGFFILGIYVFVASFFGGLDGVFNSGDGWHDRILGICCVLLACILTSIAFASRKYLDKTVQTMKISCECLFQCPVLLLEPMLATTYRLSVGFLLFVGLFLVLSTGTPIKGEIFHVFEYNFFQWLMILFYVFMVCWVNEIMYSLSVWVSSFVVERWFFQPHDSDGIKPAIGCGVLCKAYSTALTLHLGSLALGSLVNGISRPFRLVWQFCIEVCRCGGECADKYWQSIGIFNKDAFMDQGLFSNDFMPSARHGAASMNHEAIFLLAGTCWLIELLGLALMALSGGMMMFFQMKMCQAFSSEDSNYYMPDPVVPSITAACLAAVIGMPFLLSFGQIADTMLFCHVQEPEMDKLKVAEGIAATESFLSRIGDDIWYGVTFQWLGNSKKKEEKKSKPSSTRSESSTPDWMLRWVSDTGNKNPR